MKEFVLDCSATLPWVFASEATPETDALLDVLAAGGKAWVPALCWCPMTSHCMSCCNAADSIERSTREFAPISRQGASVSPRTDCRLMF